LFESAEADQRVWTYQRRKNPVLLAADKAAREPDLCCFRDKDGRLNSNI
jgi:hypothetical protein